MYMHKCIYIQKCTGSRATRTSRQTTQNENAPIPAG